MHNPYAEELDRMMQEYQRRRVEIGALSVRMREIAVTVQAPRQVVTVTVGPQGELTGLDFPTGAYRRMAPAELAAVLLSTVGEARDKALAQVAELIAPQLPAGMPAADVVHGRLDLKAWLPEDPTSRSADGHRGARNV